MSKDKIAVIGLGYVGLPLAIEFGKKLPVIGFDINENRIKELKNGIDKTLEVEANDFENSEYINFSSNPDDLKDCTYYIVTVPTPIDKHKRPNLTPIVKASEAVGKCLKNGDIVIYESTVYPGTTEEVCVPILEKEGGLEFNKDFYCGYSPERMNPGDKEHNLRTLIKVTSGSTPEVAQKVDELYRKVCAAGTHLAPSIKVAEAAKVIENTQRDLNIAIINELALIFNKLDIDTKDVLEAAGTKWNFLPFRPGLVGGHCIGVDPYYLLHKAQELGYTPEIITAGRHLNDNMSSHVVNRIIKQMISKGHTILGSKVLVLGLTFKENCPDIRNTKVVDVINELKEFGCQVEVYDPWVDPKEVKKVYNLDVIESIENKNYDAVVLAVGHRQFLEMDFSKLKGENTVLYDIKSVLPREVVDERL